MDQLRRGYAYALGAYLCWGFFPIYFKALRPATPVEILAHRVIWSAAFVGLLLTVARRWRSVRALVRRPALLGGISLAALLIAVNWGVYIYGVNSSRVVETSLGYFINPLVSVLFGLLVFGERLRAVQWVALGIGAVAVAVLTVDYGRLPWIALTLAVTFGSYGLIKKRLGVPPADGLFVESTVLAFPALGYLAWLTAHGHSTFTTLSTGHALLLAVSGVLTAIPLLLFAGAANRIPLTSIGVLQYVTPTLQLLCGVVLYHEPMPVARLLGFGLVWLALVVFTWDALRHARRRARASRTEAPASADLAQVAL
ncbi:MAG TPA: EamA family transporter RarD [Rugosimonospora sp.]|nr:EamA family transporter RarD [Rugosimonospora sp.]